MKDSKLVVILGPAGSGKDTIIKLLGQMIRVGRCLTCTTRLPRPGEVDGLHYRFLSPEAFSEREARGEFIETALTHGNRYGTLLADLSDALGRGGTVILSIDVKGLIALREAAELEGIAIVSFFIRVPGDPRETLRKRMLIRDPGMAPDDLERRLATAEWELSHDYVADYRVVNDDRDRAADEILGKLRRSSSVR